MNLDNWKLLLDNVELIKLTPNDHFVPPEKERQEEADILKGLQLWLRDEQEDQHAADSLDWALGKGLSPHRWERSFWWYLGSKNYPSEYSTNHVPENVFKMLTPLVDDPFFANYDKRSEAWFDLMKASKPTKRAR
jgi:hypothetical protein